MQGAVAALEPPSPVATAGGQPPTGSQAGSPAPAMHGAGGPPPALAAAPLLLASVDAGDHLPPARTGRITRLQAAALAGALPPVPSGIMPGSQADSSVAMHGFGGPPQAQAAAPLPPLPVAAAGASARPLAPLRIITRAQVRSWPDFTTPHLLM